MILQHGWKPMVVASLRLLGLLVWVVVGLGWWIRVRDVMCRGRLGQAQAFPSSLG